MTAWVLILFLGTSSSMTVPGIESEQECRLLIETVSKAMPWPKPLGTSAKCIPYRLAH